jgi:tRNA threonylcarbamoyladenosine biosynthesis protein TsaE
LITQSERETEEVGERLAATLQDSDVVYLIGDLGAGKTCFARGLARGRGASERQVASPTFAIVHEYAGSSGQIVLRHLDLYRLKDTSAELEVLGLPDSVSGAPVVVEWPGQTIQLILPPTIRVLIDVQPDGTRAIGVHHEELKAES